MWLMSWDMTTRRIFLERLNSSTEKPRESLEMEVMRLFLHREMDNIRARQSFFKKNFIFSVAMMVIPLLIFNFFVLGFTQEKLKNELEENAARNLQYTKEQLNQIFIEISYFKTLFVSNPQMNLRLLDSLAETQSVMRMPWQLRICITIFPP